MKMDRSIVVTCFSSAHAEAVSNLICGSLAETFAEPNHEKKDAYSLERILEGSSSRLTYVAVCRQQIVGVILLSTGNDKMERVIEALCVAPEYRGEGIGRLLVQAAEQRVSELGIGSLKVSPQLQKQEFFQRLGYSQRQTEGFAAILEKRIAS